MNFTYYIKYSGQYDMALYLHVFELPLLLVHASQHYTQLMLHQTQSVMSSR